MIDNATKSDSFLRGGEEGGCFVLFDVGFPGVCPVSPGFEFREKVCEDFTFRGCCPQLCSEI